MVDEFDDEEQNGVEPDLDLNEVVRTEAGERSGERLLLGEFYTPSRPPTADGAAAGLSNGSRAGSARGGGLMNAGAAGDAPLMRPVTPGARRAAAETFRTEEPAAAAPVPGASSKMDANVMPKTSRLQTPRAQERRHQQLEAQKRSRVVRSCRAHRTPGARPRRAAAAEERRHVRTAAAIRRRTPLRSRVIARLLRIRGRALRVVRRPLLQQTASTGLPNPNRKSLIQEYTN